MSKRFEFKLKVNFIDEETGEEIYHKVLIDNSNENEIGFDDMVGLLNNQQDKISKLEEELEKSSAFIIEQRKENKTLKEENEQLRQKLENIGLNEKNDMVKMIDGKVFIRM